MSAVGTELMRPSAAAQCIAYIAVAEIPVGLWPDLIGTLTHNFNANGSTDLVKEATLETIGYICQEIARIFFLLRDKLFPSNECVIL